MNKKYVTQREAADWLGRSEKTLYKMRLNGLLIYGTCWIRKIPQNPNSHILYDLKACEEVLNGLAKAYMKEQANSTKNIEVALA